MTEHDPVHHPQHYSGHPIFSGSCIDYTRQMGFSDGNAFKYLWRFSKKDDSLQDAEKSLWYIRDAQSHLEYARPISDIPLLVRMRNELYAKGRTDEDLQGSIILSCAEALYSIAYGEGDYKVAENIVENRVIPTLRAARTPQQG